MAARAIRDEDADYSLPIKQCSSAINCCSVDVRFCATRWPQCGQLSGGRREGDHRRTKLESCRCLRTPAPAHVGDRHHRRHGRLRTCRRRRDGRGATDVHRRSGGSHRRRRTGPGRRHRQRADRGGPTHTRGERRSARADGADARRAQGAGTRRESDRVCGAQLIGGRRRGLGRGRRTAGGEQLGQHAHGHRCQLQRRAEFVHDRRCRCR